MALVTNRCSKHGNAHPEEACPHCQAEDLQAMTRESEKFFASLGQYHVVLRFFESRENISVEELYQHFRVRLINELGLVSR